MEKLVKAFTVRLKSLAKLKRFARHHGGDMSETMAYVIKPNGELVERDVVLNDIGGFHYVTKHVFENGEEFLVIDHPNIITKREYEMAKELYEEAEDIKPSFKGVC